MKDTRFPIERILLGLIVITGTLALLSVAPGLGIVFKKLGLPKRLAHKKYLPNLLSRLKQKGFVVFVGEGNSRKVKITPLGREYFNSKRIILLNRPKKRAWDGYWRIVVFDIPEHIKKVRDNLRRELMAVGFKKLQASVWISPDECEEYLKLLKADRQIGKFLIYMKTKDIEYGSALSGIFKVEAK